MVAGQLEIQLIANMSRLHNDMQKAERTVSTAMGNIDRAVTVAKNALVGLAAGMSVREIVAYADAWQNVTNQLKTVAREGQVLGTTQEKLMALSNATRSSFESTANLYARLSRSTDRLNLSQEALIGYVGTINRAFAVSGATTQEQTNAIVQLSQGLAAGALRGEEFNSMVEQGPALMNALRKSLNMTEGELRAFAFSGGLTTELILKALEENAAGIEETFNKMTATFGQNMTVARNNLLAFVGASDEVQGATSVIGAGIVGLSEQLEHIKPILEAVIVLVGARLAAAAVASGTSFAAATAQSLAYQAALARMAGVSAAAAASQTALAAATRTVNAAMALVGGSVGAFAVAGVSAYALMNAYTDLSAEQEKLIEGIRAQNDALGDLSKTQLTQALEANKQHLEQLSLRLAKEQELANANVQFGIVDLKQTKTLNALSAEHEALGEVVAAQTGRLAELHGEVARAAEQEWADYYNGLFKSREEAEQADRTIESLILKLAEERAMLTMTAKEQDIYNFLKGEGATATQEQRNRVIAMISALHDERAALAEINRAANDADGGIEDLGTTSTEVSEAMIRDWQNVRQSFGEFFADLVIDGGNAFDALLKSWERTALQMAGNKLFDMGAQMMGIPIPGGTGSASYGAFGSVANSFLPGFTKPGAVITDAELQQLLGGKSTSAGGLNMTDLANIGKSLAAGFAGDLVGGKLGEGIFGKEAESSWGSMAGGTIGSFVGGPLGAFIGSMLGSMVDVAFGGDGKLRSNAGFLAAPTPGLKQEYDAGDHTFASGLKVNIFARRADSAQAREILGVFDQVDRSFVDLVKELGGNISVSQLTGLDEEANPGSRGAFFGIGGNGTTQGNILQQVNSYVDQLADHVTGLDQALLDSIRSATSAEEALALLTTAIADQATEAENSVKAQEDAAKQAEDFARSLTGIKSILDPINAGIQSLADTLRDDIYGLLGATVLRPGGLSITEQIQHLSDLRDQAWENHREEMRLKEEAHKKSMDLARSLMQAVTDLRLGNLSPLSNAAKFDLAQSQFRSTLSAALGGDVDAAGRLQGVAQSFAEQSQMMFASSAPHKGNMAEILAGLEQAAGIMGSSTFDPLEANNRLVEELQRINAQLEILPGKLGAELAGPMGAFIQSALAAGIPRENIANMVKGLGPSATAGADSAMPGFVSSNATAAATMRSVVDFAMRNFDTELEAIQFIADKARSRDVSSSLLVAEGIISEAQRSRGLNVLQAAGLPGFRDGGLVSGPESGYPVMLHGTERITPSGAAAANDPIVSELRALRQEVADLKRIEATGHQMAGQQRGQQITEARETNQKLQSQTGIGSAKYVNAP